MTPITRELLILVLATAALCVQMYCLGRADGAAGHGRSTRWWLIGNVVAFAVIVACAVRAWSLPF